jgi:hypothetical protein
MAWDNSKEVSEMPAADASFTWQDAGIAYMVVLVAAFLVTWITTDLLRVRRTPYVGVLAVVVFGLAGAYLASSGTSFSEIAASNAIWGLIVGLVVAIAVTPLIRRLPDNGRPRGLRRAELFAWEDVVYGTAEALLLAVLPVLAVWQGTVSLGWTDGTWAAIGSGALAVAGAEAVILVHHLGYAQFRTRASRRMLGGALLTCGLQALAFLFTGTLIAPVVAHVGLHFELTMRGMEMPPERSVIVR